MNLINFDRPKRPTLAVPQDLKSPVRAGLSLMAEEGKPGAPYCLPYIMHRLRGAGVFGDLPVEDQLIVSLHVVRLLVKAKDWHAHKTWSVYTPDPQKTSMPLILTYGIPPGVVQNIPALAAFVVQLTGVEQSPSAMRKAVSRMVQQEIYKRTGDGVYVNAIGAES